MVHRRFNRPIVALFIAFSLSIFLVGFPAGRVSAANAAFTLVNKNFVQVRDGDMAWGDYDNDGFLDLLVTGDNGTNAVTILYRNNGDSTFTQKNFNFAPYRSSSVEWGDFNNDGWIDLLMTGLEGGPTRLYRNDHGTNFVAIKNFPDTFEGELKWGDFNNDGLIDFAITGTGPYSQVFQNVGGTNFVLVNSGLMQLYYGSVDWADFDHDGDLDLLLTGPSTSGPGGSYVYQNDGSGHFTTTGTIAAFAQEPGLWIDYDNDGWSDLVLQQYSAQTTYLYRNTQSGSFVLATSLPIGGIAAGDFNADGWSDLFIRNQVLQNSTGTSWLPIATPIPDFGPSSISRPSVGDFDNDGRLDFVVNGQLGETSTYVTQLYRNVTTASNSPPGFPARLYATLSGGDKVMFHWDAASDNQQVSGLTYNLRVGTTPGGCDIISPMSADNGFRRIVRSGNAGSLTNHALVGLRSGVKYYWSVQAIDNSFAGSPFSLEASFTITNNPPVAETDILTTRSNTPAVFAAAKLTLNDTDSENDPLTVIAVSAQSTRGGTVTLASSQITYIPPTSFTGMDAFSYTVSDGLGGSAVGTVVVGVSNSGSSPLNIVFGPVLDGGDFVVRFAGIPGLTYTIEASPTSGGPWIKAMNRSIPTSNLGYGIGVFEFREPVGTNSTRYFRTVFPAY